MYTAFVYPSSQLAKLTEAEFARQFPNLKRSIIQHIPEEPAMRKLFYFNTSEIPLGVVTSTARLGREWYDNVKVGDTVAVHEVGSKRLVGYSAVVAKEFVSLQDIFENADHNSVGYGKGKLAWPLVYQTLHRAFGAALGTVEAVAPAFSVLHLLPLASAHEMFIDGAQRLLDDVVDEAAEVFKTYDAEIQNLSDALANQGTALLEAQRARRDVEKTNSLLMGIIAQKVAEQEEKDKEEVAKARSTVSEIHSMAIGHMVAAKDNGPFIRAVERVDVIGGLESTLRIEF